MTGPKQEEPREQDQKFIDLLSEEGKKGVTSKEKPLIPDTQIRPPFNPLASSCRVDLHPHTNEIPDQVPETESASRKNTREIALGNPVFFGFMTTVGVGLALLCYFIMMNVGALGGWITGALFIALGLEPAVRRLMKLGLPRIAAIITVVLVIAGALTGIILYAVPKIANQAVSFINDAPAQFQRFMASDLITTLDHHFGIKNWITSQLDTVISKITQDSSVVSTFFGSLVNVGSVVASTVTGTIIVLFLSLYFLSSMPLLKAWFVRLSPATKRAKVEHLTEEITDSVGNYVMGQALVAIINGCVALTLMIILGVPFPQLLTLFVVVLAFIPLIGGVSAGVIVSLVALTSSWQTALYYAIGYFIYLQVEAYFVSPRIMSKAVSVPGGIAVIAVAAGGTLWGVLGAIIAIPVAASLVILVQEVLVPRQDRN